MPKLTGNRRFRVQNRWFRSPLLVMQLEVDDYCTEPYSLMQRKKKKITWWRDARPEDIMVEEEISISEEIVQ